jgi:hypothetical protein
MLIGFHFRIPTMLISSDYYVPTVSPTGKLASLFLIFLIKLGPLASKQISLPERKTLFPPLKSVNTRENQT